jgi:hypothetical protein
MTSAWKMTVSEPASMKSCTYRLGSLIIRCVSNFRSVDLRSAFTVPAPKVMFGANWPSMTSRWTMSAPPFVAMSTASLRLPRS